MSPRFQVMITDVHRQSQSQEVHLDPLKFPEYHHSSCKYDKTFFVKTKGERISVEFCGLRKQFSSELDLS
jgi:hypothetical protein